MRRLAAYVLLSVSCLFARQSTGDVEKWIAAGKAAYREGRFQEAVQDFQKAVEQQPTNAAAHQMIGSAYISQYVPGEASEENQQRASKAKAEFLTALDLDPTNKKAISELANLTYEQAVVQPDQSAKTEQLDQSSALFRRVTDLDPNDKTAFYMEGVIAWTKWHPAYVDARSSLGMQAGQPGPFSDAALKARLLSEYGTLLDDGIADLKTALTIDPGYVDAISYLNLIIRERADLRATQAEYANDLAEANSWLEKAAAAKSNPSPGETPNVAPAPPPTSAPRSHLSGVRIGGQVMEANVIRKVQPIYPPLAQAARVQGSIEFTVQIDKEGKVANLELVRGHPLLVPAAKEAVLQWLYRPTLLNGQPVEVVTDVVVNFSITPEN